MRSNPPAVGRHPADRPNRRHRRHHHAWRNFRARVDYRYRSDYIEGLDTTATEDEWFSARESVDAEVGYRFSKGLSIFASGTNLTHRPQVSYTGFKEFPEDVSYSGRKYTFGVEYRF